MLLTVKDTQRSHDFYTGVLGFRLSDWVCIDDHIRLCFLRCNARHHSIAFAPCMPGKSPRLQHVMLEVESLDDVMRAYHFLRTHKAPIGMGPGRHPNRQTIHVYVQTPGGFAVEFGWGHRRLDDATHQPIVYPSGTPVDIWAGTSKARNSSLVSSERQAGTRQIDVIRLGRHSDRLRERVCREAQRFQKLLVENFTRS